MKTKAKGKVLLKGGVGEDRRFVNGERGPGWLSRQVAFLDQEARREYFRKDADDLCLADFQTLSSLQRIFDRMNSPIKQFDLLYKEKLLEICGVDTSAPPESKCLFCQGAAGRGGYKTYKTLVLRRWSLIDQQGNITHVAGNFIRFVNCKTRQMTLVCLCGLPEVSGKPVDDHLCKGRTYRLLSSSPRRCYSYDSLQKAIRDEKEAEGAYWNAKEQVRRQEEQRYQEEREKRRLAALEKEQELAVVNNALDSLLGY